MNNTRQKPTPDFDYIDRDSHVELIARTKRAIQKTRDDIRPPFARGWHSLGWLDLRFTVDPEEGKRLRYVLRREGFTVSSSHGPEWQEPTC
jgi:hypothetical protein